MPCIDLDNRFTCRVEVYYSTGGNVRASFTASKACSWSLVFLNGLRVLRSGRRRLWPAATSVEKPTNCLTNPMNDRSSDTLVGFANCHNAFSFFVFFDCDAALPDIISDPWNAGLSESKFFLPFTLPVARHQLRTTNSNNVVDHPRGVG